MYCIYDMVDTICIVYTCTHLYFIFMYIKYITVYFIKYKYQYYKKIVVLNTRSINYFL